MVHCGRTSPVHDPGEHAAVRALVARGVAPQSGENVERQRLGECAIAGEPQDQREDDALRALVEPMWGELIAGGDRSDQRGPVALWSSGTGVVAIEDVAQCA